MSGIQRFKASRFYFGVAFGLVGNLILIVMALPYLFVPSGSVLQSGASYRVTYTFLVISMMVSTLPLAFIDIYRNWSSHRNILIVCLGIGLCLSVPFVPLPLQKVSGDVRQIRTPCLICDGDETFEGFHLVN